MAPAPNPGSYATVAAARLASIGLWRLFAVAAPQLGALVVMLQTETDLSSRTGFLLSWGILNCFWIALQIRGKEEWLDGITPCGSEGTIGLVLLLSKGARIDAVTSKGTNLLSLASQNGHNEIVKFLFDRGTAG